MAKTSNRSPDDKLKLVLSMLRGEMSGMEAATSAGVTERTVQKWQQALIEGGRDRLASGERGRSARELDLEAENGELKAALGEAHMQLRQWKRGAE